MIGPPRFPPNWLRLNGARLVRGEFEEVAGVKRIVAKELKHFTVKFD